MTFWIPKKAEGQNTFSFIPNIRAAVGPEGHDFVMGGVIVAALVDALEQATERPLLWTSSQFVSTALIGDTFKIDLDLPENPRRIVQARATMSSNGQLLNSAIAALGGRTGPDLQFVKMPTVPAPDKCLPKAPDVGASKGNLVEQFERRVAFQDDESGVEHLWFRPVDHHPMSAGLLAIIADFLLGAHPVTTHGTSLDNTFRLHNLSDTDWILTETQITATSAGVSHGSLAMFASDGTLLATANQTGLLPRA